MPDDQPNHDALRLPADQLARRCAPDAFDFKTTADLPSLRDIIGQPRGVRAIEFGIDIQTRGYNIYVMGEQGTGRLTAIERFIRSRAADDPVPDDWMYVHNFASPHEPRALRLPAGQGRRFCQDLRELIKRLKNEFSRAFEAQGFTESIQQIRHDLARQREHLLAQVQAAAAEKGFAIRQVPNGMALVALLNGDVMTPEQYEALSEEARQTLEDNRRQVEGQIEEAMRAVMELETRAQSAVEELRDTTATRVLKARLASLRKAYADHPAVLDYLTSLQEDVLRNLESFAGEADAGSEDGAQGPPGTTSAESGVVEGLHRYEANLIVDHADSTGAPVVVVTLPTYQNLVGRIEHRMRYGALTTDFSMIKAGALHQANGGFLVIRAVDILQQPFAWQALKRALNVGEAMIEEPESQGTGVMTTQVLEPQPIPVRVKVVMLGSPMLYYLLYDNEEDFAELFKVKADFAATMDRDHDAEQQYAHFIAARCHEDALPHFTAEAVGRVVDYSSWLAEDQQKLSTRFGEITNLVHEAAYYAAHGEHESVTAEDVQQAIDERRYRSDLYEELSRERILDRQIIIQTEGMAVGQINGLTVLSLGDHTFGLPARITARVYAGEHGLVQIEREVRLSGPIHDKGLLTLQGYLGSTYATDFPLTLTASLSFEQNYGGVEGDSASSTELYALLSAIAGLPLRQDLAVTGSVDQYGTIQPIGGATAKIEGFFHICQQRGLTGTQGVMIPRSNARNLMLNDAVRAAVEAGEFHIYAIESIDQGIELLMGETAGERQMGGKYPSGTVHHTVQSRLRSLAEDLRAYNAPTIRIHGE